MTEFGFAIDALDTCNWALGRLCRQWLMRDGRNTVDAFAGMLGLSAQQLQQRVNVHEKFDGFQMIYQHLRWSHFYAALTWDDAHECLKWANEMQATVMEMKAWRRAQRGEPLCEPEPAAPSGRLF